jgi:membrane protein
MLGSAISFNIILYQIPLLFLTLYVINIFGLLDGFDIFLEGAVSDFLPPTEESEGYLNTLILEIEKIMEFSSLFGIIGLITLLWLSSNLVSGIRYSLNTIFKIPMNNYFFVYKFRDMLIVIALSILILIYTFVMPIIGVVQEFILEIFPGWFGNEGLFSELLITATTLFTGFIFFYLVYKFTPTDSIPRKTRALATLLATIIIELSRHLFAWYLVEMSNYGKFYGGYAAIVSMAIWIYYSSIILLLAAEFSKLIFDFKENKNLKM